MLAHQHRVVGRHLRGRPAHADRDGRLATAPVRKDANFGMLVPETCPEVPSEVLDPRGTWSDKKAYDETARALTRRFAANFAEFEPFVGSEVKEAAIRPAA